MIAVVVLVISGMLIVGKRLTRPQTPGASLSGSNAAIKGKDAPDFQLTDLDGKTVRLADLKGKAVLLNFWATWCPPCREEIPLLIDLQKQHAAENLQVIGVAIDDKTAVLAYRQSVGMNYPTLLGNDNTMQLIADYGNRSGSLPYTVIIDRHGAIVVRKLGIFTRAELESLLDPLLTKPAPPSPTAS